MAKANASVGSGNQRIDSATKAAKRYDYRAPKLTVVGTVHDLTLGLNSGSPDGLAGTRAGG